MLHRSRCQCLNFGFDFFSEKNQPTKPCGLMMLK
jgi:hypothetical protein